MAWVDREFTALWRSGRHFGDQAPTTVVEFRRGNWRRAYRTWTTDPADALFVSATIPGETHGVPWRPIFAETTSWVEIPNVVSCDFNQQMSDTRGVTIATVVVDNVAYVEKTGAFGDVYHAIERGFMSPTRGFEGDFRPPSGLTTNEWNDAITEMADVRIWQGYGQPHRTSGEIVEDGGANGAWVFHGLIDDVDADSVPSQLTIVARAGKVLTDSRLFGWNISKQLRDPVTFCDRLEADLTTDVGDTATASGSAGGHDASAVADDDGKTPTYWISDAQSAAAVTVWVEVHLPAGRYVNFSVDCDAGLELFAGFSVRDRAHDRKATQDGVDRAAGFLAGGMGAVPGAAGGWQFVAHVARTAAGRQVVSLNSEIVTGNDSVLRVGFRSLNVIDGAFRARVRRLQGRVRRRDPIANQWILVDDVSDMVKVCLRWAGYDEWDVEPTGVRLAGKAVFNRANYLIDPILKAAEQTGFVYFLADPSNGSSQGVPTFRRHGALQRGAVIQEVTDSDLLTGVKVKRSEAPLGYIIRVRGKESLKGISLGGDTAKRITAVYLPPWTADRTLAGIIKHVIYNRFELRTLLECEIACYLIAIQQALAMTTGVVEIPAHIGMELDDQIGLMDTATGLNTRLWVTSRDWSWRGGENREFKMTLSGAMVDTPDLDSLVEEIDGVDFYPLPSPTQQSATRKKRTR